MSFYNSIRAKTLKNCQGERRLWIMDRLEMNRLTKNTRIQKCKRQRKLVTNYNGFYNKQINVQWSGLFYYKLTRIKRSFPKFKHWELEWQWGKCGYSESVEGDSALMRGECADCSPRCTQRRRRTFFTHFGFSVEITDPKRQLKPWSEIWLRLVQVLQQLSNEKSNESKHF